MNNALINVMCPQTHATSCYFIRVIDCSITASQSERLNCLNILDRAGFWKAQKPPPLLWLWLLWMHGLNVKFSGFVYNRQM